MLVNAIIASSLLASSGFAQMSMPSGAMDPSMTMATSSMDPSMTMATSSMDPSMTMATSSMDPSMTISTTATMEMSGISTGTQVGGISSTSSTTTTTASSAVTSTNAASGSANSVKDLFAGIGLVSLSIYTFAIETVDILIHLVKISRLVKVKRGKAAFGGPTRTKSAIAIGEPIRHMLLDGNPIDCSNHRESLSIWRSHCPPRVHPGHFRLPTVHFGLAIEMRTPGLGIPCVRSDDETGRHALRVFRRILSFPPTSPDKAIIQ
ncbi:hypothetical protein V493_00563 [Pseudogymnoascus sp. VKM F-4281 (FW-2241)]|nr:hypothetical protein V493_00563 [Pseudogymnoascus sp. VKM F-4281 (FW-2241)]